MIQYNPDNPDTWVAGRISRRLRGTDTVARLGGDEFAVILEGLSRTREAAPVCRDILSVVSEPVVLDGRQQVTVSASVGVASNPPSENVLEDADAAMYRAKAWGRNRYEIYDGNGTGRDYARLVY